MLGLRCSSQGLFCGMQSSYLWHLTLGCSVHAVLVLWLGIEPWTVWIGGMESYPLDNQGSPYSFYRLLSTRHSAGSEDTMGSNKKDTVFICKDSTDWERPQARRRQALGHQGSARAEFTPPYRNRWNEGFLSLLNLPAMWETWVRSLGWGDPL